jgi:pimeloyl-ACP methyl ester carboxylesterase
MATKNVNGVRLRYELTASGKVPLVLVHGSWGDHHIWDGIVPALARSFRVLTYDRRGTVTASGRRVREAYRRMSPISLPSSSSSTLLLPTSSATRSEP